ncbi:GtrA family protein [Pseudomonas atagonensis]|uniref:GtrA family protein n=1 Tax=Pseudomonas atagonensis TaxID=2609964 RepID=UPI00140C73F6
MAVKQFAFFLASGGLAAGLNWGSRFLFSVFFQFEIAVVLAFLVGLLSGFILMRLFVFDGAGKPLAPQIGKYIVVNLLALAQTLIISIVFARWVLPAMGIVQYVEATAHLIGVLIPVVTSYFGHKLLTFR